ncbi:hypothetical protein KI387_020582, partial [Taxus chinensis]
MVVMLMTNVKNVLFVEVGCSAKCGNVFDNKKNGILPCMSMWTSFFYVSKVEMCLHPQCPYPDASLGKALQTGLFDYVWIQFYNNYCQYSGGDASTLINLWKQWTTSILKTTRFFLGLPASTAAAGSGFIPAATLKSK